MSSSQPSIGRINYLNAVAYAANFAVTYAVGAAGLFDTPTNAELSEKYQTIVTPAGWAFAIWGVIFAMQLVWAIAQLLPAFRASTLVTESVSWYYIGVCAAQIAWTFTFSFELMLLALAAMLSILYFLLKIVSSQYKLAGGAVSTRNYWLLVFPFSIHFGWIIAASLVNVNLIFVRFGASGTLQFIMALLSLVLLLLATTYFLHLTRPDFVIPCVLAWASIAIGQELKNPKELIVNTFSARQISVVRTLSIVAAALILAATIVRALTVRSRSARLDDELQDDVPAAQASDGLLADKE